MSIASAIQTKQQQVAAAYTACNGKGATMPATQDLTNLATCIGSIQTGSTPTLITKNITANGTYNASSDDADGYSSVTVNVSGGGAYPIGNYYVMNDDSIQPIYFSDVKIGSFLCNNACLSTDFTTMDGTESGVIYTYPKYTPSDYHEIALSGILNIERGVDDPIDISNVKHINLSGITGLVSISGANHAFRDYFTSLESVDMSNATSCKLTSGFAGASLLESVDLSSLSDISTSLALGGPASIGGAFAYCTFLTTLSFPSLNSNSFGTRTNQFNNMLLRVTGCTVHFPSNLQSVIGSWTSVTAGFGGTNTTVLFDLPATT